MRADDIDEALVRATALLVGLELTDEQLPGVIANLKRTAQIAAPVMALPLSEQDELGPVWRP
jgi:hypothetical protein